MNSYFSDIEAIEACIRLHHVMWCDGWSLKYEKSKVVSLSCIIFCVVSVYVPEVMYTLLLPIDYVHDSQSATNSRFYTYSIVVFCFAPKRPSPFFLYIPHKKTLF